MKTDEREKRQELDDIEAQLARHRKATAIGLTVLVTLAGLALFLIAWDLFDHLTPIET
ncbi:MAG TPA: hypothetical protein VEZ24_05795 [Microvirga sp.]|nr:hypothetical protein [Microvirga sp.]